MPIGYDFICENADCIAFKSRLTLTGPWPLVSIDDLLQVESVAANAEMSEGLRNRQKEGRQSACAIFPNKSNLKFIGARVQMFCPSDKMVWDIDFNSWDYQQKLPTDGCRCYRCKGELITAEEAKRKGLNCPHCNKIMTPNMWFTPNE